MPLETDRLKRDAMEATGLSTFGDAPMDEGLDRFVWSVNHEASRAPGVQAAAEDMIRGTLIERLKVEATLVRNSSMVDEAIVRPLFVISLPRSGSTATSQFLSEDPQARSIRRWECLDATPPPDQAISDDPRLAAKVEAFEKIYRDQPDRRGMLPVNAKDPSEHGPLLGLTFQNLQLPSLFTMPSYSKWLFASDLRPAYGYLRRVLQLLQWKTPAPHWNLKNPPDIFGLDALLWAFPDARLVWTHRDPVRCIPSVSSLTAMLRTSMGEQLDRNDYGPVQLEFQAVGAERAVSVADNLPEGRIFHVMQRDVIADTVGSMQRIYDAVGLDFSDAFRAHLMQRVQTRERPSHCYRMEDYGLSAGQIRQRFKFYTDRFDVPLEA